MINFEEIKHLESLIKRCKIDPLVAFVAADTEEKLAEIRQNNLTELLTRAKNYGTKFIYVGVREIAGCEEHKIPDGRLGNQTKWTVPVMWVLASEMGFPGSCGNYDQYQCEGSYAAFPEDARGGWNLETMTKLTDEETKKLKFCMVTDRKEWA